MHKSKNSVIIPPVSKDEDSKDSSLIVYTITVAIAIALFVLTLTIPKEKFYWEWLNIVSAALLVSSSILTFISIEYLVDITSFGQSESNKRENVRGRKYLNVLRLYNFSVILIVTSLMALLVNYFMKLAFDKNIWAGDYCILLVVFCVTWYYSTRKWWSDLYYLYNAEAKEKE